MDIREFTVRDVLDLIGTSGGWFSVTFVKKSTGELRTLNCRCGVKKHLKGGSPAYNFTEKGLISVWSPADVGAHGPNDNGYRAFAADMVTEIRANGQAWKVRLGKAIEVEE